MREKGNIVLLSVVLGFAFIFLFGYQPDAMWKQAEKLLESKSVWEHLDYLAVIKPFLVFALGSYLGAALPWLATGRDDHKEEGDYVPWLVCAGATVGWFFAVAGSLIPPVRSVATMPFTFAFLPIFHFLPKSFEGLGTEIYNDVVSCTIPFLVSIIAASLAWEVSGIVPAGRVRRTLHGLAGLAVIAIPLFLLCAIDRDDFLLKASALQKTANQRARHAVKF